MVRDPKMIPYFLTKTFWSFVAFQTRHVCSNQVSIDKQKTVYIKLSTKSKLYRVYNIWIIRWTEHPCIFHEFWGSRTRSYDGVYLFVVFMFNNRKLAEFAAWIVYASLLSIKLRSCGSAPKLSLLPIQLTFKCIIDQP